MKTIMKFLIMSRVASDGGYLADGMREQGIDPDKIIERFFQTHLQPNGKMIMDYPHRTTCPYCKDYAAANVHDLMRHMADHYPVEKAPAQNLEQEMETGEPVFYTMEDEVPLPPEWKMFGQEDEDACFAGHYESELRENRYGGREDSYSRVAQYWTDYLYDHPYEGLLDEEDVALMMALFKIARWQETAKFDHLYDAREYLATAYHKAARGRS